LESAVVVSRVWQDSVLPCSKPNASKLSSQRITSLSISEMTSSSACLNVDVRVYPAPFWWQILNWILHITPRLLMIYGKMENIYFLTQMEVRKTNSCTNSYTILRNYTSFDREFDADFENDIFGKIGQLGEFISNFKVFKLLQLNLILLIN
jgi:hypothetical protein